MVQCKFSWARRALCRIRIGNLPASARYRCGTYSICWRPRPQMQQQAHTVATLLRLPGTFQSGPAHAHTGKSALGTGKGFEARWRSAFYCRRRDGTHDWRTVASTCASRRLAVCIARAPPWSSSDATSIVLLQLSEAVQACWRCVEVSSRRRSRRHPQTDRQASGGGGCAPRNSSHAAIQFSGHPAPRR